MAIEELLGPPGHVLRLLFLEGPEDVLITLLIRFPADKVDRFTLVYLSGPIRGLFDLNRRFMPEYRKMLVLLAR